MNIIEAKEVLLDMFLNDMLEELCENRLEEYIDNWVYEVEQNQELSLYYRHSDMAILDLSICLCFELQQPKKIRGAETIHFTLLGVLQGCFHRVSPFYFGVGFYFFFFGGGWFFLSLKLSF